MSESTGKKAVRALAVVGSGKVMEKVLSFGTTLVLARLLSPEDYGIMAMAVIVIGFVDFFNEIGISSAIVQRTPITQRELDGCFWISVGLSISLYIITVLAAPLAASAMGAPVLANIVPVLAIGFIFGGVGSVSMGLLRKEMNYRPLVLSNLTAIALQGAVAVALAWAGKGVWALVAGSVVAGIVRTLGIFISARWRPSAIHGFRDALLVASYGLQITYSRFFYYLSENLDSIIIGRLRGDRVLGLYSMGTALSTIATSHITSIVVDVASPLFAKLQNDTARLSQYTCQITRGLSFLVFPILFGSAAVADDIVPLALGEKWIELIPAFRILCFAVVLRSVAPVLSQLLISTGHARAVVRNMAWNALSIAVSVAIGVHYYGLPGAATAWLLVYPTTFALQLYCAVKLVGLSLPDYFTALRPALIASVVMFATVTLAGLGADYLALPHAANTLAQVITGALAYVGWLVYCSRGAIRDLRDVLLQMGIAPQKLTFWPFSKLAPGTP
jgi:O-antigen/teichoic acid export membrane protein